MIVTKVIDRKEIPPIKKMQPNFICIKLQFKPKKNC